MKKVLKYKEKNDIPVTQSIIEGDELVLGLSGIIVNERKSYKNMKKNDKFDESKIVYENKYPDISIGNNYNYYIKEGNKNNNYVAIIVKISNSDNLDNFLSNIAKNDTTINFFVDGKWLEENVATAFSIVNLGNTIYNLGYNGEYDKRHLMITNNMIESISMEKSNYCLLSKKNDAVLNMCKKKKMHTLLEVINNPTTLMVKERLENGLIMSFDLDLINLDEFNIIIKSIRSKGYVISRLSEVISEDKK